MENVNKSPVGIGLKNIFRNILWENNKIINFFDNFFIFIFHENSVKNFFNIVY